MRLEEQNSLSDLLQAEKTGWDELESLIEGLSPEQADLSGYLPEWSVKDFMAHLAGWLAEAGRVLQLIELGSFTDGDVDVDSRNDTYLEANRDQPLSVVFFELKAARRRLLHYLHSLTEIPPAAWPSLRKGGPQHYAEHLPRLRDWVAEL